MKVQLEIIIEAIETVDDTSRGFLNIDTMEIVWLNDYFDSEENERLSEEIDNHFDCYLRLPTQWDINEYSIMEEFVESLESADYQNRLYNAIKGKGAFRRFKSTVRYLGIEQLWYDFRDNAYVEIAQKWCRDNDIEFE